MCSNVDLFGINNDTLCVQMSIFLVSTMTRYVLKYRSFGINNNALCVKMSIVLVSIMTRYLFKC